MTTFDAAAQGSEFCISRYRDPAVNLRTQLTKIIRRPVWNRGRDSGTTCDRPGKQNWPNALAAHAVSAWIGSSPQVALRHYLQVTEDQFERAAGGARNARQHLTAQGRTESHDAPDRPENEPVRSDAISCEGEMGHTGLEPVTSRV